jgi:hypothetical protein
MFLRIAIVGALLVAGMALADDEASRAKLMGSWQTADAAAKDTAVWTISEKGDTLHVITSTAGRTMAEFDCDSFGHECTIKVAGHTAKVSLWYNGPKLVEMETRGSFVWKRTFLITGDGDTMELEQTQIAPAPKSETMHFKRVAATTAAH